MPHVKGGSPGDAIELGTARSVTVQGSTVGGTDSESSDCDAGNGNAPDVASGETGGGERAGACGRRDSPPSCAGHLLMVITRPPSTHPPAQFYRWTAPTFGFLSITVCPVDEFDSVLSILKLDESGGIQNSLACNDDAPLAGCASTSGSAITKCGGEARGACLACIPAWCMIACVCPAPKALPLRTPPTPLAPPALAHPFTQLGGPPRHHSPVRRGRISWISWQIHLVAGV